jgi:hypothetical protein
VRAIYFYRIDISNKFVLKFLISYFLPRQKLGLSLDAPAIARKRSIGSNDTVTWDCDGKLVAGAGPRHGPHGAG